MRYGDQFANERAAPKGRREKLKRRGGELKADDEELFARLEGEEEENLVDGLYALRLELQYVQCRREAEAIERAVQRFWKNDRGSKWWRMTLMQ